MKDASSPHTKFNMPRSLDALCSHLTLLSKMENSFREILFISVSKRFKVSPPSSSTDFHFHSLLLCPHIAIEFFWKELGGYWGRFQFPRNLGRLLKRLSATQSSILAVSLVSQVAGGPLKLKRNGEGLDKMLSRASFSKWAKRILKKNQRFKSLPYLEILWEKKHPSPPNTTLHSVHLWN